MPNVIPGLTARAIKVTLVLDPAGVLRLRASDGEPHVMAVIHVGGRTVHSTLNAKSVRKAQTAIRAAAQGEIAVIIQGKLTPENEIAEAGISAQVRAPRDLPQAVPV